MKWTFLCLAILLSGYLASPVKGADDARDIWPEEELKGVVLQLNDPVTEMAALRRLINFSGPFLYELSVVTMTNNPADDALRRKAAIAVHAHSKVDSVGRALQSDDRMIRRWGVMSFDSSNSKPESWKTLLPRLEVIAAHDEDAAIRSVAVEKLQYKVETVDFLKKLQESPDETDPHVLMVLLQFNSQLPDDRARWYARAVGFLSQKEEAIRLRWLLLIWGNVTNSSTARMWRIEADPALVESLRQIERTGSKKEQELARPALQALTMGNMKTEPPTK